MNNHYIVKYFVKMPDGYHNVDELNDIEIFVSENELSVDQISNFMIPAQTAKSNFEFKEKSSSKNNHIFAIQSFLLHVNNGFYPPKWVLTWLKDSFQSFMDSEGGAPLDKCLGLPYNYKEKKTGEFERSRKYSFNYYICYRMYLLVKLFGLTYTDAAVLESEALKTDTWWKENNYPVTKYTSESLEGLYKSSYKKLFAEEHASYDHLDNVDFKKKFIKTFSLDGVSMSGMEKLKPYI